MLGIWHSHAKYQLFVIDNISSLYTSDNLLIEFYSEVLSKLYIFNLDVLKPLLDPYFSTTGKPYNQQPEIFHSFILMSELHYPSIPKWVAFLKANAILCCAIGVSHKHIPGVGSHYDFIDRLWLENTDAIKNVSILFIHSSPSLVKNLVKTINSHHAILGLLKNLLIYHLMVNPSKIVPKGYFNNFLPKSPWNHPPKMVS